MKKVFNMASKQQLLKELTTYITQGEELERDYTELQQELLLNLALSQTVSTKIHATLKALKELPDVPPDEPEVVVQ